MTRIKQASLAIIETTGPAGTPIGRAGISQAQVRTSLFQMLKANVLCSIATVTPDHQAHINTAYFCYSDELELYFLSHPNAMHCRNLETNSSTAMTVFSSSQTWGGTDQGLQLFGTCARAQGIQAKMAQQLYQKRFPAFAGWQEALARNDAGRDYRWYRFRVTRVKVFDEREWGDALFVQAAVRRNQGKGRRR